MIPSTSSAAAPLRIPRFRVLWATSVLSNVGSFLQQVAASWLMLQLTGSATWVGLMVASSTLPLLAVALPAGAMADLLDRRRVIIAAQAIMAVAASAMAIVEFLGLTTPGLLLGLGLLLGTGFALNHPAWQALVPDLVPRALVPDAVALNSASFNVARAVGPALGGALVATLGPSWAFGINAVSFVGIIVALVAMRGWSVPHERESSVVSAIALGLRYARFTAAFRWLLLVAALFAVSSAVLQAMLPNLTDEVLGGSAATYGLLLGAMGAGALLGAFTRPWALGRLDRRMVPTGITMFGVAGILVGLSRSVLVTGVFMALAGVAWVWTLSTLNATAQLLSPQWVRGRIMSLYTLSFVGITPLGAIVSGVLGDLIGVANSILVLSVCALALGVAARRWPVPVLGEIATPEPAADYEPPPHPVAVEGGPVLVLTTFVIDERELDEFLDVLAELRLVRLRTGAFRWRLYRNVGDPHRMTELFAVSSWEQHLAQHRRIDQQAAEVMRRAHSFDRDGGPRTVHLAAIDVAQGANRPGWEQLLAVHEEMHRTDGSARLDPPASSAGQQAAQQ